MRFGLVAIGSRGDVEPFVMLAAALAERGHTVTLAVDDGYFEQPSVAELRGRASLAITSIGSLGSREMRDAVGHAISAATPLDRSQNGYRHFIGHRRTELRDRLVALASAQDVVVTSDSLALIEHGRLPWVTPTALVWYTVGPESELRRLLDVAALHLVALPECVATRDPSLRRRLCYTGFWLRDPGPVPKQVEQFLATGPPPMFLTMGSMIGFDGASLVTRFSAAARTLGERAIVQRGWAMLAVPPTDDVLVVDEINYGGLFPHCRAVFVHGGTGTIGHALRAGVPTAVLPLVEDQAMWARVLSALGVGLGTIDPRVGDDASFMTAMQRARDGINSVARTTLANELRGDALSVACAELERMRTRV